VRRDLPPYIRVKRGGSGKEYLYYERHGRRERMPDFPSPVFYERYAALEHHMPVVPSQHTWKTLIALYRADKRWTDLSSRTMQDYEKPMTILEEVWGDLDPRRIKRSHVLAVMRENAHRYRWANDFKTVVSRALDVAMDNDWLAQNVAKTIPPLKPEKTLGRQPWPRDLIEAFRKEAPIDTSARLLFELCLGTGQRISDVLVLKWNACRADTIYFTQSKTGRNLDVPYTATLRIVLDRAPRTGLYVVCGPQGQRFTYRQAQHAIMTVRKVIGAEAFDIHALRHTAAWELYEAGCTDEEVQSITGHSATQMLRLYGGAARQREQARRAQTAREQNETKT